MPNLEFKQISHSFETGSGRGKSKMKVLDNLDLTIGEGEFCTIVGPSGCGKSTMLRIADGLIRPDQGEVLEDGKPVSGPSLDRGVVFQQFHLLPWRSVLDNIKFGLENLRLPSAERDRVAREWIETVGLDGFEDHYPSQLSGGMQQRVGLARALAIAPKTILMDEPFGAVDAQTRFLLQEEIVRIWERDQRTVLFITHDIEEALFLGDTVVVMSPRPGRIFEKIEVPFDRPRTDKLRGDPKFAALKEHIWSELKTAILSDPEAKLGGLG